MKIKNFKLTEFTSPADIFLHQENLRSQREWAQKNEVVPIPKFEKVAKIPLTAGVFNMCRNFLGELRP